MNIAKFAKIHSSTEFNLDDDGQNWGVWSKLDLPQVWRMLNDETIIWVMTREGVLDRKTLRALCIWVAKKQMTSKPKIVNEAIKIAFRYIAGKATKADLSRINKQVTDEIDANEGTPKWKTLWLAGCFLEADEYVLQNLELVIDEWIFTEWPVNEERQRLNCKRRAEIAKWLKKHAKPRFI